MDRFVFTTLIFSLKLEFTQYVTVKHVELGFDFREEFISQTKLASYWE